MKYLLLLLPIVLISLCSSLPNIPFVSQQLETVISDLSNPDIFVKVEALSSQIRGGRDFKVFFELRNKQSYDLTGINFDVYDHPCIEDSGNFKMATPRDCKDTILKPNESCTWTWRWTAKGSDIDKLCQIKFVVSYAAHNTLHQDIAVLSAAEYERREIEGTLGGISITSSSPQGPLNIFLTFSEPQPFLADLSGYGMDINYHNRGNGFFENIVIGLTVPSNMLSLSCEDYESGSLRQPWSNYLKFIKGRSVSSICTFDTSSPAVMDVQPFSMDIDYTYKIYNTIPISIIAGG